MISAGEEAGLDEFVVGGRMLAASIDAFCGDEDALREVTDLIETAKERGWDELAWRGYVCLTVCFMEQGRYAAAGRVTDETIAHTTARALSTAAALAPRAACHRPRLRRALERGGGGRGHRDRQWGTHRLAVAAPGARDRGDAGGRRGVPPRPGSGLAGHAGGQRADALPAHVVGRGRAHVAHRRARSAHHRVRAVEAGDVEGAFQTRRGGSARSSSGYGVWGWASTHPTTCRSRTAATSRVGTPRRRSGGGGPAPPSRRPWRSPTRPTPTTGSRR